MKHTIFDSLTSSGETSTDTILLLGIEGTVTYNHWNLARVCEVSFLLRNEHGMFLLGQKGGKS